jgi:septal ring factor EnvC (AmiA/AmiB activator)
MSARTPRSSRFWRTASRALALFSLVLATGLASLTATASDEEALRAKRDHWQDKYRALLYDQARLKDNLAKLRHDYAQAQRRNYPRGGAREALRTQAATTEQKLAKVERKLAQIFDQARAAEVPPGWLYQVDDDPIVLSNPASKDGGSEEAAQDLGGHNPLYFDNDR